MEPHGNPRILKNEELKMADIKKVAIDGKEFWQDQNGNTWDRSLFSPETAEIYSDSMRECLNCKNCRNCLSCVGCVSCVDCILCVNCRESENLVECVNCRKCNDCADCVNLQEGQNMEGIAGAMEE